MRTTIDLIFVCCVRIFAGAQVTIDINVMMVLAYFAPSKVEKNPLMAMAMDCENIYARLRLIYYMIILFTCGGT